MLDNTDLKIIREFCKLEDGEKCTTWQIMKKIFPRGLDVEHTIIKQKLNKMSNYGLFLITLNEKNRKQYDIIEEKAVFKKFKFPDRLSKGIALRFDGKWQIIEL
jgi:hypothetical protein